MTVTYSSYLRMDELLNLQQPLSEGPEHDETLFIIIHQVYELWFKQILHETNFLIASFEKDDRVSAMRAFKRILTIFKTLVLQVDVIETMTSTQPVLRLRLGVAPLFASQRLIPALPSLREAHPALHLDIDTAAHSLTRLGEGLDVAITLAREVDDALYSRPLGRNIIYPIGARRLTQGPHAISDPKQIQEMTVFTHRDMPDLFDEWSGAVGLRGIEPAAVDHFDSGQLMLEAAAQGLGIAFMHESHLNDAHDERLVKLFEAEVESPYIYWFACRPRALSLKPVKIFHDWLMALEG